MGSILTLTDGTSDSVSFIDDSVYKLEDGTFVADIPAKKEKRAELTLSSGRDLISLSYNNRTIRFTFYVFGTTDIAIRDSITKVGRLLLRTHSPIYINGGSYSDGNTYAAGFNTGDNGLILRVGLNPTNDITAWTNETPYEAGDYVTFSGNTYICLIKHTSNNTGDPEVTPHNDPSDGTGHWEQLSSLTTEINTTILDTNTMTYRIVSGDLKVLRPYSAQRKMNIDGSNKHYAVCEISLEAEPFALGEPRVIAEQASPGFKCARNARHAFFVSAADIPGDGPALTRISTNLTSSDGITIARDAGVSLLNSTSAPSMTTGSGKNDLFVWANHKSQTIYAYEIEIAGTGTPNQYKWRRRSYDISGGSWNGYGSYSSNTNIVAGDVVNIDGNVYIYFANSTGHTLGNIWYFETHQVGLLSSSQTTDLSVNAGINYEATGRKICTADFTIPRGCRSKYKVVAISTFNSNDPTVELMSRLVYIGVNPSTGAQATTQPIFSDWVLREQGETSLGIVDLTPSGAGFTNHPLAFGRGRIEIYLRAISNVVTSPATEITVSNVYLIPIQDEDGCMDVSWDYDGDGYEMYCNYDYNNPYVAETDRNYFSSGFDGDCIVSDMDYSASAGPITLIPGVDNTVFFFPRISGTPGNWRLSTITTAGATNATYMAIRPRYLHGA